MHIHHDHVGGHCHDHDHDHHHHDHECHCHDHEHEHEHECHCHDHDHDHGHCHDHGHDHQCGGGCCCNHEHTPMEELVALMKYMIGHNASHANELAELAVQLKKAGRHIAYEQVMAAVTDFEKGNLRLSAVMASLDL